MPPGAFINMAVAVATTLCRTIVTLATITLSFPTATSAEWKPGPQTQALPFAGQNWLVKDSANQAVGPGPNVFVAANVRVEDGRLHLRVERIGERWTSAEVVSWASFGYGRYTFEVQSDVANLDPNLVLGLFTWSDDPAFSHREIDIEISRWGDPSNQNAQCVVQPYQQRGARARFELPAGIRGASYTFTWLADKVTCEIGSAPTPGVSAPAFRFEHQFTEHLPVPGDEHARINLWQLEGRSPARNRPEEVVISGFSFTPVKQ
jgi:hypothetical protein